MATAITKKESCPVFAVADLLGKKWTLPLLQQIEMHGGKGFNELMRQMKKVSPKILTERLKALESQQIIKKEIREKDATKIAYYSTEEGKELQKIILSLRAWSEKHNKSIQSCSEKECVACERY